MKLKVNLFSSPLRRYEAQVVDGPYNFSDTRLSDPYKQLSEIKQKSTLDDVMDHSRRVSKRQKEAADIFRTPQVSGNLFDELWKK